MIDYNKLIASVAALKAYYDVRHATYIEIYLDFIIAILPYQDKRYPISATEIQKMLNDWYGFTVPIAVINSILKIAVNKKLITYSTGVYHIDSSKLPKIKLLDIRNSYQLRLIEVIKQIIEFSEANFNIEIDESEAQEAFLQVIDNNLLNILNVTMSVETTTEEHDPLTNKVKAIVALFIKKQLSSIDDTVKSFVLEVAKGLMLYTALSYSEELPDTEQCFGISAYLDSMIIIRALGYSFEEQCISPKEFIEIATENGVHLICFTHTLEEIKYILTKSQEVISRKGYYQSEKYYEVTEYFKYIGATPSDILLKIGRLEKDVRDLGIAVVDKPEFDEKYSFDESKLERELERSPGYANHAALLRDIDSYRSIYILRKGRISENLKNTKFIFITTNNMLIYTCAMYFREEYEVGRVSLGMTLNNLVTILWLRNPKNQNRIPDAVTISNIMAAMRPDNELLQAFIKEIEKLLKEEKLDFDSYIFLRYDPDALAVMNVIHSSEEVYTEGTHAEILRIMHSMQQASANKEAEKTASDKIQRRIDENSEAEAGKISNKIVDSLVIAGLLISCYCGTTTILPEVLPLNLNVRVGLTILFVILTICLWFITVIRKAVYQYFKNGYKNRIATKLKKQLLD
jgi:hypothetical protein